MKAIKYIIASILVIVIGYNSVYFKKLDEVKAIHAAAAFNAVKYAQSFWDTKLMPNLNKAIDITTLTHLLATDTAATFDKYSHALGIGNLRYFLVKGKAMVKSINEDNITLLIQADSTTQVVTLATEYIFGNAVRDATGLININEFNNTMDFNNVSAELNKIIRARVLPPFRKTVKKGADIEFTGVIELNKEHLDLSNIEVIPVQLH